MPHIPIAPFQTGNATPQIGDEAHQIVDATGQKKVAASHIRIATSQRIAAASGSGRSDVSSKICKVAKRICPRANFI
jgi:hypothetical protein